MHPFDARPALFERSILRTGYALRVSALSAAVFLSCSACSSQTPISDAAYPLLLERTRTNRQAFYIYRDADSAFNHGFASGFFASSTSVLKKIHVDVAAIDDPNSPRGVSTNLSVLDPRRGNVLRISFDPLSFGQFAGINFEEPLGWGTTNAASSAYDLRGASSLVFDLRNPDGKSIMITIGVSGNVIALVLATNRNWQTVSLPLTKLSATQRANAHLLIGVSGDNSSMPNGGTVLLDNIRFKPTPWKYTNALGFAITSFDLVHWYKEMRRPLFIPSAVVFGRNMFVTAGTSYSGYVPGVGCAGYSVRTDKHPEFCHIRAWA